MSRRFFELILAVKRKCQRNEEEIQEELGLSQAEFNALIVLEEGRRSGCAFERMAVASRGSRVLDPLVTDGYVKMYGSAAQGHCDFVDAPRRANSGVDHTGRVNGVFAVI
jgi:hypothetical protein